MTLIRGSKPDSEEHRVARAYDSYARSARKRRKWAARSPGNVAIRAELTTKLMATIGDRLVTGTALDIGCGTGWWLRALVDSGVAPSRLYGVEVLEHRALAAHEAVPGADIRHADARRLPFEDGRFEVVTMICLLSSLGGADAIRDALAEARRVLRPAGALVAYEPRVPNPFNRRTRFVSRRLLNESLGGGVRTEPLTVLPPLSRALERIRPGGYPRLAKLGALLTHRLIWFSGTSPP